MLAQGVDVGRLHHPVAIGRQEGGRQLVGLEQQNIETLCHWSDGPVMSYAHELYRQETQAIQGMAGS